MDTQEQTAMINHMQHTYHVANKRHTDIQLIPSYCDLTCYCV